ncbi:MAG TPA: hypothetical protein VEA69_13800 [Tepidisphaeraceae bacterium]|nr:hypothetical protein [Tepidisphaeraceae bacterium]
MGTSTSTNQNGNDHPFSPILTEFALGVAEAVLGVGRASDESDVGRISGVEDLGEDFIVGGLVVRIAVGGAGSAGKGCCERRTNVGHNVRCAIIIGRLG